jgi:carbonic anhydrase
MDKILAGVARFRREEYPKHSEMFELAARKQQRPVALFITCADSRIHPNLITMTDPGELFLIRNAGNIIPPHGAPVGGEAATVEYSVEVLGIRNIILCGHSQCGAMKAMLEDPHMHDLPAVKFWCQHAEATKRIVQAKYGDLSPADRLVAATEENVLVQLNNLSTHPCVAARLANGELKVFGWYYDIATGEIRQFDQAQGRFVELNGEAYAASPLPIRNGNAAAVLV